MPSDLKNMTHGNLELSVPSIRDSSSLLHDSLMGIYDTIHTGHEDGLEMEEP